MTIADNTLPHQIVLMMTSRATVALDGSVTKNMGLAVTCNCHQVGHTNKYRAVIAALPVEGAVPHAWRSWNRRSLHNGQDDFRPNEKKIEEHGILV